MLLMVLCKWVLCVIIGVSLIFVLESWIVVGMIFKFLWFVGIMVFLMEMLLIKML